MNRTPRLAILAALAATVLAAPRVLGCAPEPPITEPFGWMPADADAFLIVDHAAGVRVSDLGGVIEALVLIALPATEQTMRAWSDFAGVLGWTQEEAFDAILGRRLVLMARGLWSDGAEPEWAIVCDVSPETEKRVRLKLAAFPREIVAGSPLLSVEEGRFNILVHRSAGATRLVVAPSHSAALVRTLAGNLRAAPAAPFASSEAAGRLVALTPSDALAWIKFPEPIGGWWGGGADIEPDSARARVVTSLAKACGPVEAWSLEPWDELFETSAALVIERLAPEDWDESAALGGVFETVDRFVRPALEGVRPQRLAVLALTHPGGGLRFAAGVESDDAHVASEAVDSAMATAAVGLGSLVGLSAERHEFAGLFPLSVRRVDVSGAQGRSIAALGNRPMRVSWRMASGVAPGERGWWLAGLDDGAMAALEGAASDPERGRLRRYLSVGVVRPRMIGGALRAAGAPLPAAFSGVERVEQARWVTWLDSEREMHGRIEIKAAPRE